MGAGKARPKRFAQQNISHSEGIYHTPQAYITSRQRYITSVFGADKYRFVLAAQGLKCVQSSLL
jgi:hypothetical protein